MGGNDSFLRGLRKNLIYDIVKFGNIAIIAGFLHLVIEALGFDDPEDESLKYNWNEYRIGSKIGLGEDGKGVPIYAAWWLNDLTLFGLPWAYSLSAAKLHPEDEELPRKLFRGGCYDMVSGCSLLDMFKIINNAPKDFETLEQMMHDPDAPKPPDWISYGLMQAELFAARSANKMIPSALKNWRTDTVIVGQDKLDRTAYKTYNRNSNTPGATKTVESWEEMQRRIESKYNPLYALWNNITKNGYLLDDGTSEKTGYLLDEMPIATQKDQLLMSWSEKFNFDPDNIPGGEENRIPYTESKIEEVLYWIDPSRGNPDAFNSPEEAANSGFMIPYNVRSKMRDYCYQHINAAENLHNQKVQNGEYANSTDKSNGWQKMSNEKNYWYDILNNWVFSEDIPWSDDGYAKLLSDTQTVYYWKESGKPAAIDDLWRYGDELIEIRYIPKGNHPTSLLPFTMADSNDKGYNFETKSKWYREGESGTNLDRIFSEMEGVLVPRGRDTGVEVNTAIFGGQPNTPTEQRNIEGIYGALDQPTMGYRGYVAYDKSMLDDLRNVNREDVGDDSSLGDLGIYKDKDSWTSTSNPNWNNQSWPSSSGKRSYSSGSGSSPKIYSNPRSVNADKAATMYTKQPYSATNSYLRPAFSTKGSREAYKRQDM